MFPVSESSVLDPQETKPQLATYVTDLGFWVSPTDAPVLFRHSGWAPHRKVVFEALRLAAVRPGALQRFLLCGSDPWVVVNPENDADIRIQVATCKSRWCVPCARTRAGIIIDNLAAKLREVPTRFITLTLKHSPDPLTLQLNRLYDCFRQLRAIPFWKDHVDGGAAVLEIGFSRDDRCWHPHLHVVVEGSYIPWSRLRDCWLTVTGDSFIVDVRPTANPTQASGYLAKYITKPVARSISNDPARLADLIKACRGRRLLLTFGNWRGIKLTRNADAVPWKPLCDLRELLRRRDDGDSWAKAVYHQIYVRYAHLMLACSRDPPPLERRPAPPFLPPPPAGTGSQTLP